ncbi:Hypothetical_protein [Hexamita inflata]|uniref:Hypothetical_protein n=1 Tax=Hexamita inflata TaxID=28002 RepID=A0AA86PSW2_9EUKA|nr:Hypothetical protein HINF_LOCUS28570 [Hexamita inflata]CAI9959966.1 Hypothetical protein HINF_LOCUS47611 [Hexamita inflata]
MEADMRFEGAWFKTWQGNESFGSQKALFENICLKARKIWISTEICLDKLPKAREFLCLTLLEALAALTLLTDSLTVRLQCLISSALLRSLPKIFLHFHFPQQKSESTHVSRFSVLNPGREMKVLALRKHFLRNFVKKQGKSGF